MPPPVPDAPMGGLGAPPRARGRRLQRVQSGSGRRRPLRRQLLRRDRPAAREGERGRLARAKVERQIELLKGVERPESESKPTVYYRLLEERHGERPGFVYELTISLGGGETVKRRALVIVREEAGAWRAVNFEELD
jgi:hypothetical protein